MFYKQIYGIVFLLAVSFFRKLSPGKAFADYFYLDRVFIAVPMISFATQAVKSPKHLRAALLTHENQEPHAGIRQAEEMPCHLSPTSRTRSVGRREHVLEMAKPSQTEMRATGAPNTMCTDYPAELLITLRVIKLLVQHKPHPTSPRRVSMGSGLSNHCKRARMGKAGGREDMDPRG